MQVVMRICTIKEVSYKEKVFVHGDHMKDLTFEMIFDKWS
jgi:hypothetical protein